MIKDKSITLNVSHLILGAIILLLLWLLLKPANVDLSKYDKQKQQIDSLSRVITELQKEQLQLDKSIFYHQNKIDSLDNEINNTNKEISDVREYYGKKIRDILNYTPQQLDDFFSKRYK
jgi:peptidoglycan hydrolase CwlO-like protein